MKETTLTAMFDMFVFVQKKKQLVVKIASLLMAVRVLHNNKLCLGWKLLRNCTGTSNISNVTSSVMSGLYNDMQTNFGATFFGVLEPETSFKWNEWTAVTHLWRRA